VKFFPTPHATDNACFSLKTDKKGAPLRAFAERGAVCFEQSDSTDVRSVILSDYITARSFFDKRIAVQPSQIGYPCCKNEGSLHTLLNSVVVPNFKQSHRPSVRLFHRLVGSVESFPLNLIHRRKTNLKITFTPNPVRRNSPHV